MRWLQPPVGAGVERGSRFRAGGVGGLRLRCGRWLLNQSDAGPGEPIASAERRSTSFSMQSCGTTTNWRVARAVDRPDEDAHAELLTPLRGDTRMRHRKKT